MSIECFWPDEEAPWDWDDPPVCRQDAVCIVRFVGAKMGIPSCENHAERVLSDAGQTAVREPLEPKP